MAVAYTPTQLANLQNDPEAVCKINYNANLTQTALQDALSLSGNSPNQMESNLDMNSNRILNLPAPASAGEPVRLADITSTTALALSYPKMTGVITATGGSTGLTATFSGSGNLPVSQLNSGINANSTSYWNGTGAWTNPFPNSNISLQSFYLRGVNFNAATTDNHVILTIPSDITRYRVSTIYIQNASTSLTNATIGVFTGVTGGGLAVATTQAVTVATSSAGVVNSLQQVTLQNASTINYTSPDLYFRVNTAQGNTASADVTFSIQWLS